MSLFRFKKANQLDDGAEEEEQPEDQQDRPSLKERVSAFEQIMKPLLTVSRGILAMTDPVPNYRGSVSSDVSYVLSQAIRGNRSDGSHGQLVKYISDHNEHDARYGSLE